jgi:exosortase
VNTSPDANPETGGALQPDRASLLLVGAATSIALALCFVAGFASLAHLWSNNEFYAHAYAIPFVVAYFVYESRRDVAAALRRLRPPVFGSFVVLGVGFVLAAAVIGDAGFLAGIGIPVLLGATLYAVGGSALLRSLLLPLAFLALMVPPPGFLQDSLLVELKLLVTDAAVGLLQFGGASVLAEGNQIVLPAGTLFVADACSGLTSIVTMLPISCIVAYFMSRGIWRRAVVVASVAPLAMAANIVRVTVTAIVASRFGIEYAQGSLHESFGLATYVIGTLALIAVARVMR